MMGTNHTVLTADDHFPGVTGLARCPTDFLPLTCSKNGQFYKAVTKQQYLTQRCKAWMFLQPHVQFAQKWCIITGQYLTIVIDNRNPRVWVRDPLCKVLIKLGPSHAMRLLVGIWRRFTILHNANVSYGAV